MVAMVKAASKRVHASSTVSGEKLFHGLALCPQDESQRGDCTGNGGGFHLTRPGPGTGRGYAVTPHPVTLIYPTKCAGLALFVAHAQHAAAASQQINASYLQLIEV